MKTVKALREHTYTLASDAEVSFRLVPLSSADRIDILYNIGDAHQYGHAMLHACQACVKGWSGVVDEEGKPLAFSPGALAQLDTGTLIELANYILKTSELSGEEKKA